MRAKTKWKSFNIRMPDEIIPLYNFLNDELNFFLSNDETRNKINNINIHQLKGNIWRDLRDVLVDRISTWENRIHNKTWHSYILFENIRRIIASKEEATIIWSELVNNNMAIDEMLFDTLNNKHKCYPTYGQVKNIKDSNEAPELPYQATFVLDYTVSEKQFFKMTKDNFCSIKVSKDEWIDYQIVLPSSIYDDNITGRIAKPRFVKRKKDERYIGVCSYEYIPKEVTGKNVMGVDLGLKKLFSAVVIKDGEHSHEFTNSKAVNKIQEKLSRLHNEKTILYEKINQLAKLNITTKRNERWMALLENIRRKIIETKEHQAKMIASEICAIAYQNNCSTINIENLSWLGSQGGKWNHSEIQSKITEKAEEYNINVSKVSAFNSSKQHPITDEIGTVVNRNIVFSNNETIDRDLLAAINIAIRNKKNKQKITKIKPRVKSRGFKNNISRKKVIKQFIENINKGKNKIVFFLPNVDNDSFDLSVWPSFYEVYPHPHFLSLLCPFVPAWGNNLDVTIYAKPEFNTSQMWHIRNGLEKNLDVLIYARPEFDWRQMKEIRLELEKKQSQLN